MKPTTKNPSASERMQKQILPHADRQLERSIVTEREERIEAINELWTKIGEIQEMLTSRNSSLGNRQPDPQLPIDEHRSTSTEKAERIAADNELRAKIDELQEQFLPKNGFGIAPTSRSMTPASRPRLELDDDLVMDLDTQWKDLRVLQKNIEQDHQHLQLKFDAAQQGFQERFEATMRELNKELSDQKQYAKDFDELRFTILSFYQHTPVNAIRMCQCAIRSADLSPDDRQKALEILKKQETEKIAKLHQQINEDPMAAIRNIRTQQLDLLI